ncbi:hypothetical protein LLEC1_00794 [Akanthomyces lecanii]|uniref:NAD dependent epimerase/dehydratase n=1 Tax=Cordyceps confragosa TaxID=2714763 RepID=A0A179I886_CORDF|nr:hypothetical protein LLEC1_00794 [Akanthomyces lecanii]
MAQARTALCSALQTLGLRTYNYYEIFENKEKGHFQRWLSAVDAKYNGVKQSLIAEDLGSILEGYNVVAGSPCWMFVDELLAAYPDAKVILSTRPPDAWLNSLRKTAFPVLGSKIWKFLSLFDRFSALHWRLVNRLYHTLSGGERPWKPSAEKSLLQFYQSHNEYVRRIVPGHKLLEYRPGDGWGPLCSFLDISIPEQDFPHANAGNNFVETEKLRYWSLWRKVVALLIKVSAAVWMMLFFAHTVFRLI